MQADVDLNHLAITQNSLIVLAQEAVNIVNDVRIFNEKLLFHTIPSSLFS